MEISSNNINIILTVDELEMIHEKDLMDTLEEILSMIEEYSSEVIDYKDIAEKDLDKISEEDLSIFELYDNLIEGEDTDWT